MTKEGVGRTGVGWTGGNGADGVGNGADGAITGRQQTFQKLLPEQELSTSVH
jgi:hypothetical protein